MDEPTLEARVERLAAEVRTLGERILRLEARLESSPEPVTGGATEPLPRETGEAAVSWGATTAVLSRTALVCFVLVVALILRTATDSGLIGATPGAALGIVYASGLLLVGGWFGGRRRGTGSVLASCGILLLCLVVLEASGRLGALPLPTAYVLVAAGGAGVALVGWLRGAAAPVCLGAPAVIAAGVLLGLPRPPLPGVTAALVVSNLAALTVGRRARCGWLRPLVVIAGAALAVAWAWGAAESEAAASWPEFGAATVLLGAVQVGSAFRGGGTRPGGRGAFDLVLPSLAGVWIYATVARVSPQATAGWGGLLGAAVMAALAWARARRGAEEAPGSGAFLSASALLLAMALPATGLNAGPSALVLAGFAMGCALASARWQSGGARLLSYAVQVYAVGWGAVAGGFEVAAKWPWTGVLASAAASGVAWVHHRWSRRHAPPERSPFFARWRGTDDLAVAPLLASLVFAFLCLRLVVYPPVSAMASAPADVFAGVQSVIIHCAAAGLVVAAYLKRDGELRVVGLLVTGVGAIKALLLDLLSIRGLPLVASVLTFGAAAAVIAVVLGRWHGRGAAAGESQP